MDWREVAGLLPAADAERVLDAVSIGEQEGALDDLVACLVRDRVTLPESVRTWILAEAEDWDVRDRIEAALTV
ncbi:MAG: hypothetical protein HOY78_12195 [Saccharothrix sp.]|nr:hypothetical protein [Saccharothrix sp.]